MDLDKFSKICMMTTSQYDGEVLNAARLALRMLSGNNLDWHDFISQKTIKIVQGEQQPELRKYDTDDVIERMLIKCISKVNSASGRQFLISLAEWYTEKGFLTQKQKEALKKWYDNL